VFDPTTLVALEMAPRLVAEQFSEDRSPRDLPRKDPGGRPVRRRAARALRVVADILEPAPQGRPAS
jgi:hypothetical protein